MVCQSKTLALPKHTEWLTRLFRVEARRQLARTFHAVRLARTASLPALPDGPAVVVLNHPSWWDPLIGVVLSEFWPQRRHLAPIAATALERYPFLEKIGFFGVEPGTAAGGRSFLRTALALTARPDAMLWITAQGRFTDPRERPVVLQGGVGHLVRRLNGGCVLPLALEYPFWSERGPEALALFGPPIAIEGGPARSGRDWTVQIAGALEAAQDALAPLAMSRNPAAFDRLVSGVAGVGGLYDAWRWLRALFRGERFHAQHDPPVPVRFAPLGHDR